MLDLDDIKRRLALPDRWGDDGDDPWSEDMPLLVAEVERLRAEPSASCELFIAGRKVELPAALPTTAVESFIRAFWGKDRVDELLCWVEDGMPSPHEWELRDY